ncbi:hypothetical protein PAPYR_8303 [Paratrimastix pyriformis]|uniref:Uncharacterized protein n=1 Tax=Paratrimastix pyriformis TaxID=342808 RepID=A0ABQ8UAZ8_9EUKA|nr:hypothetical protein PAPYR_8303 [Paratrimastix pyriformis]
MKFRLPSLSWGLTDYFGIQFNNSNKKLTEKGQDAPPLPPKILDDDDDEPSVIPPPKVNRPKQTKSSANPELDDLHAETMRTVREAGARIPVRTSVPIPISHLLDSIRQRAMKGQVTKGTGRVPLSPPPPPVESNPEPEDDDEDDEDLDDDVISLEIVPAAAPTGGVDETAAEKEDEEEDEEDDIEEIENQALMVAEKEADEEVDAEELTMSGRKLKKRPPQAPEEEKDEGEDHPKPVADASSIPQPISEEPVSSSPPVEFTPAELAERLRAREPAPSPPSMSQSPPCTLEADWAAQVLAPTASQPPPLDGMVAGEGVGFALHAGGVGPAAGGDKVHEEEEKDTRMAVEVPTPSPVATASGGDVASTGVQVAPTGAAPSPVASTPLVPVAILTPQPELSRQDVSSSPRVDVTPSGVPPSPPTVIPPPPEASQDASTCSHPIDIPEATTTTATTTTTVAPPSIIRPPPFSETCPESLMWDDGAAPEPTEPSVAAHVDPAAAMGGEDGRMVGAVSTPPIAVTPTPTTTTATIAEPKNSSAPTGFGGNAILEAEAAATTSSPAATTAAVAAADTPTASTTGVPSTTPGVPSTTPGVPSTTPGVPSTTTGVPSTSTGSTITGVPSTTTGVPSTTTPSSPVPEAPAPTASHEASSGGPLSPPQPRGAALSKFARLSQRVRGDGPSSPPPSSLPSVPSQTASLPQPEFTPPWSVLHPIV